jgi:NTP pyrophosphatase (non-canonical NTP hydrolase)
MNTMDLKKFQKDVVKVFDEYDAQGTQHWTYQIAAQDLAYQYGSLAKRLLQLEGKRFPEGLSKEQLKEKIADELVDMLAEVVFIADRLDIDLEQAASKMFESDRKKIEERSSKS